jgi:N-acetyl-gamma-glutamyl-phosphate reductase
MVFLALPHGTAAGHVELLWEHDVKIVDLSADYRLPPEVYQRVYGKANPFPQEAVYGLPELHPDVAGARLVANPGCYPTGAVLSAAPLVNAGLVETVIFDSKSGVSGAGAEPTTTSHYPNMAENIIPYSVTNHRHGEEIKQELGRLGDVGVRFTPHIFPGIRGILTTAHLTLRRGVEPEEVERLYGEFYAGMPFVRLQKPHLASVRGTNFCDVAWEVDLNSPEQVVALSAIDNLVKGAAGAAVQNMNLIGGLDEKAGLLWPGMSP